VAATNPPGGNCTDPEMSVTPLVAVTLLRRGAPVDIGLTIKNVGTRTCSRDVGAGPQELFLDQGGRHVWSSDRCSVNNASDVREFPSGAAQQYRVSWNGHQSSACAGGVATGPPPSPGRYELRGRLGTLVSAPVAVTIVG